MSDLTTNLQLKKPLDNETADIAVINENMDKIDTAVAAKETPAGAQTKVNALAGAGNTKTVKEVADEVTAHKADYVRQPGYGTTAGSANTYTLTLNPALTSYAAGVGVTAKIHAANTGASTININGLGAKSILDSKGNAMTAGKLRLNGVYTLRYDGINFISQGEGGSGNAVASNLLSGKTASVDAGDIVGTMPNKSTAYSGAVAYDGNSSVGRLYMQPGYGYYDESGTAWIYRDDPNFIAANFPNTKNIFGLQGTMPNRSGNSGALAIDVATAGTIKLRPPDGYYDGVDDTVYAYDVDFVAANIKSGINIFGLVGALIDGTNMKKYASGTFTVTGLTKTLSGFDFTPRQVILICQNGSYWDVGISGSDISIRQSATYYTGMTASSSGTTYDNTFSASFGQCTVKTGANTLQWVNGATVQYFVYG
jgi:hypothetical protein